LIGKSIGNLIEISSFLHSKFPDIPPKELLPETNDGENIFVSRALTTRGFQYPGCPLRESENRIKGGATPLETSRTIHEERSRRDYLHNG
jgi:hypothetical protein